MLANLSSETPFSPRSVPFFYGWIVVAAATGGILFSLPGQTMGVSVFSGPLLAATGLNRVEFSNAYLIDTLGSAALLPWAGIAIDRAGVRLSALLAGMGLGLVLGALSQVDRIALALATVLPLSSVAAAFATLTIGFTALRLCGQGVLTLASNTMLARWFDRRRGRAVAVSGAVVALGFAFAPLLLDRWIARAGWRGAWLEIGGVEFVGMSLLAFVFFRDDPESCGLALDGATPFSPAAAEIDLEACATRAEALRTRAFWVLSLALALHGLVMTGITLHVIDLGAEGGLARTDALAIFPPIAMVSIATGALVGWVADYVRVRTLLLTMLASESFGYFSSAHLGHPFGYWSAAIGLGLATGHFGLLSSVGLPRLFGRRHLGKIAGASMTVVVVGSAVGPSLLAASRAALGSYEPALLVLAVLPIGLVMAALRPLHPRDVPPDFAGVKR